MSNYSGNVTTETLTADPFPLARAAADHLRASTGVESIDMAFILGSGWSQGASQLGETVAELPLETIPGFSAPVVAGHGGEAIVVRTESGRLALVYTGRTHYYEGRGTAAVVHGVRVAAAWGATTMVITNGCGGLHHEWTPGTVVVIRDHINLTADSPLIGATFVDLSTTYTPALIEQVQAIEPLPTGVYVQFRGPHYETPAEVRMARILGGDLVGMSTTLEAIAATEAGMRVLGLSLVTNAAAGVSSEPLDHSEVIAAGKAAGPRLAALLHRVAAIL